MRIFLITSCIFAIAVAAPQGYNYNGPSYSVGSAANFQQQYSVGGSFGGGVQYSGGSSGVGGSSLAFNSFNPAPALPSASSVAAAHRARPHTQRRVLPPIISKHVYLHSAPEEPDEEVFEDNSSEQQHRHYNVVFIKAPHQSVKTIAAQTAQAINEEKTAIYVLSKKNDVSEIRQAISNVPHHPAKPEVFFVKYKTPEEAQHAQQTIQSQYESLGGSTHVSDEGFAPVSSVVGAFDVGHVGGHSGGNGGFSNGGFSNGGFSSGGHVSGGGNGFVISGGDNFISAGSNIARATSASYLPPNKV
ncbi:uncharacterized protein LOC129612962 [Condylostylus longicornis]|uniref:uncharacterized protein LOC129612962 n=1 Tax=Condylostylus longicornis TaxID=2530218 RepID=UPI00244E32FA|nr:uncharacterized protein LOC129612962 [Condylostylus longicornis]